ncbi:MAG TPA: hypothetical protein VLI92_05080 [Candidatus Saccharimonadales bacterium]|nr:hypothetical protein [Candidatus Saccharimonadales bacterium]
MQRVLRKGVIGFVVAILALAPLGAALAASSFFNGFEVNTAGWYNNGGTITRVASGTNGITSATGAYHAEAQSGVYTDWGGYENVFPSDGYVTQLDVFLDTNVPTGQDARFEISSAIGDPSGNHRRDFVYSVGTNPGNPGQWIMSASNNSGGWPANPGRDPFVISQSGWYTFRWTFQNNGSGVLDVVMDVLDTGGNMLHMWDLSDPTDIIGTTVGGSRYGWLVDSAFPFLAFDNTKKYNVLHLVGPPTNIDQCKKGGWQAYNNPAFPNQGQCVSFVNNGH